MTKEQKVVHALRLAKVAIEQALLLHEPKKISKASLSRHERSLQIIKKHTRKKSTY